MLNGIEYVTTRTTKTIEYIIARDNALGKMKESVRRTQDKTFGNTRTDSEGNARYKGSS